MERNFCYGRCAGYAIDIATDGTVTFVGEAHVAATHGTRKISRDRMRALGELVDAAHFFELGDVYGTTGCGSYVWKETMTIRVMRAGKTKSIERYHGCESAPAGLALDDLADAIELVTESAAWIGQPKNG